MESNTLSSNKYVQLSAIIALIGVVIALAAYANLTFKQAQHMYTADSTITVSGEGEVLAKPDIGEFTFSVLAEAPDATTAQSKSADAVNKITAYLKDQGVDDKDVKTQNYSLNPKYTYEQRICPSNTNAYCPPGNRKLDGYKVSQSIRVKVRKTDQAGELLSGVGDLGATNISGLRFTIDDPTSVQADARKKAIDDAKSKAQALASDLGVHLGRLTSFNESNGGVVLPYAMKAMEGGATADSAAPSVPTGENKITSNVTLVYEIQ